jgi:hypothetical protein
MELTGISMFKAITGRDWLTAEYNLRIRSNADLQGEPQPGKAVFTLC